MARKSIANESWSAIANVDLLMCPGISAISHADMMPAVLLWTLVAIPAMGMTMSAP